MTCCEAAEYDPRWCMVGAVGEQTGNCGITALLGDWDTPVRRSLPRPLMPLLLFLYVVAKYSQSSRSASETLVALASVANFCVNAFKASAWNRFWWDCERQGNDLASKNHHPMGNSNKYTFKFPRWVKSLLQLSNLHTYGLVWRWTTWCARTLPRWANLFPQTAHS